MSLADDIARLCRDARTHGVTTIDVHSLEQLVAQHTMAVYPLTPDSNDDTWRR